MPKDPRRGIGEMVQGVDTIYSGAKYYLRIFIFIKHIFHNVAERFGGYP